MKDAKRASPAAKAEALRLEGVTKRLGSREVLQGVDARFHLGELTLVRAARGAGRTTLARLLAGQTAADTGAVLRLGPAAPLIGAAWGFDNGSPALEGLELRAAAYGLDFGGYVDAVAERMSDPEALRRPFGEIAGLDRAMLIFAAGWLTPSTLYVVDGSPLPANAVLRARLRPLYEQARAAAAVVWIGQDTLYPGVFWPDRFLRLADGRLSAETPPPTPEQRREGIRAERRKAEAAARLLWETEKAAAVEEIRSLRREVIRVRRRLARMTQTAQATRDPDELSIGV